jgi:hypothetical protein
MKVGVQMASGRRRLRLRVRGSSRWQWIPLVASLGWSTVALAGEAKSPHDGSKRTVVKFDGDTIDGSLMRPDGDLVSSRPDLDLPSLAQPPTSFARASERDVLEAADRLKKN